MGHQTVLLICLALLHLTYGETYIHPVLLQPTTTDYVPYSYLLSGKIKLTLADDEEAQQTNRYIPEDEEFRIEIVNKTRNSYNLNTTAEEEVKVYGATNDGKSALLIECTLQRLPISTHEMVMPFLLNFLRKIDSKLQTLGAHIPEKFLSEIFLKDNKQLVDCQRSVRGAASYTWTISIPVIESPKKLSIFEIKPLYFGIMGKDICSPEITSYTLFRDNIRHRNYQTQLPCPLQTVCPLIKISPRHQSILCIEDAERCNLNCEPARLKLQPFNSSTIAVSGVTEVYIECTNTTTTAPVPLNGLLLISPGCLCTVEGFEGSRNTCPTSTQWQAVRGKGLPLSEIYITSGAPVAVTPIQRKKKIRYTPGSDTGDQGDVLSSLRWVRSTLLADTIILVFNQVALFYIIHKTRQLAMFILLLQGVFGEEIEEQTWWDPSTWNYSNEIFQTVLKVFIVALLVVCVFRKCLC